jgi:hypothetical protein
LTLFLKVLEKQQEASISTGLFAQKMCRDGGLKDASAVFRDEVGRPEAEKTGSSREFPEENTTNCF